MSDSDDKKYASCIKKLPLPTGVNVSPTPTDSVLLEAAAGFAGTSQMSSL
jgi:hypothetical protein